MAVGETQKGIIASYRALYGVKALSVPPDEGLDRATWALPVGLALLAAGGVFFVGRRLRADGSKGGQRNDAEAPPAISDEELDARLARELARLEEEE